MCKETSIKLDGLNVTRVINCKKTAASKNSHIYTKKCKSVKIIQAVKGYERKIKNPEGK